MSGFVKYPTWVHNNQVQHKLIEHYTSSCLVRIYEPARHDPTSLITNS
jgi:hypothetical protein